MGYMFTRVRIHHFIAVATFAVAAAAALFLFLPGSGEAPPPETVGGDAVFSGSQLVAGEFDGTSVADIPEVGQALTISPQVQSGEYVSTQEEAGYPFNALGLHWLADTPEGASVAAEVRFSQDGQSWGDWQAVSLIVDEGPDHIADTTSAGESIGELLYADEARHFQYRFNLTANEQGEAPVIQRVTASYIDAKGYHESPLSVEGVSRKIAAWTSPPPAAAAPNIISRAQWGANEAYRQWDPQYVTPKKIILHHTVTSNSDPDPAATVRSIYYYHAVSLGWGDIGYNYLVDRQGRIYEGRYGGNGVVGGHAMEWNYGSVGISVLGNHSTSDISPATYWALVSLMVYKSNQNLIDPTGNAAMLGTTKANYLGHRDVGSTACPGDYLYQYLPRLRSDAKPQYSPIPVIGAIRVKWDALGGAPGAAIGAEYAVPGGRAQDFNHGRLIWDSARGRTSWVYGGILKKYDANGREGGFLGLPTSDEYSIGAGRANDFVGGKIYWSGATNAHVVYGAILSKFLAGGGIAAYGFPTEDESGVTGVSGARQGEFQRARIYWDSTNGARTVFGAILAEYLRIGGPNGIGLPKADERDVTGVAGARQSDFASGAIYWSPSTGSRAVYGAIHSRYVQWGGPGGFCGLPAGGEYDGSTGRAQDFQKCVITYYESHGSFVTYGSVMHKYKQLGGPKSSLGPAIADEAAAEGVEGARESRFKGGRIYWSPATGARGVYGSILRTYINTGGSAALGIPVLDEQAVAGVSGGRESQFQKGRIYYAPGIGSHAVYGGILAKYLQHGGPTSAIGLPTSGEKDAPGVAGARQSDFQRGRVYWSESTGTSIVYGAILSKYNQVGACSSSLGIPTSDEFAFNGGRRNNFQGGYIYWSPSTGAVVYDNSGGGGGGGATVTSDSSFGVFDGSGNLLVAVPAGQTASVNYSGGTYSVSAPGYSGSTSSYIRMGGPGIMKVTSYHDVPSWNPSLDDNRFRGTIEIRYSSVSNKVWVINELPMEYYLRGIAESSAGSPPEFLKTMSVAARGYALYHVNNGGKNYGNGKEIFHLKNSRNGNGDDQVYKGYGLEARFSELVSAVNATSGQVVTYGGAPIVTPYFSNTDGRTRSAQEAWGTTSWPWLQSVADPDCNGMSLNGHGVGLSGHGAYKRAERGNSYVQILTYYYTSTAVQGADTAKNIRVAICSL
ncbi:MAG: N-acetylmuramoyl-L-alanine amidase [Thermoleophilia bacterium]